MTAIVSDAYAGQGGLQRLDVGDVPHVFYRDSQNWYRRYFDCARGVWLAETLFPVEYRPSQTNGMPDLPIEVGFSETYDHAVLAAWVSADAKTIVLNEYRGGKWQRVNSIAWSSGTEQATGISQVFVLRTRVGDVAKIFLGSIWRYLAVRSGVSEEFRPVSSVEGCLGHFCVGVSTSDLPRLELDGTATVTYSWPDANWYRVDASGRQSLLGNAAGTWSSDPKRSIVRSDGSALWWKAGTLSAQGVASNGNIVDGGVEVSWTKPFEFERMECFTAGCRVFSAPDTGHLVTVVDGNRNLTATRTSYFAISDQTGANSWSGSYAVAITPLIAGVGPIDTGPGGSSIKFVQVLKFYATGQLQLVAGLVTSSGYNGLPVVFWKPAGGT